MWPEGSLTVEVRVSGEDILGVVEIVLVIEGVTALIRARGRDVKWLRSDDSRRCVCGCLSMP